MPIHKIRQFEEFCGIHYVSEYLCSAAGKVVINIPVGKKASVEDLAEMHAGFAEAITLLSRHYLDGGPVDETISALSHSLKQIAFHRQNAMKHSQPELEIFDY